MTVTPWDLNLNRATLKHQTKNLISHYEEHFRMALFMLLSTIVIDLIRTANAPNIFRRQKLEKLIDGFSCKRLLDIAQLLMCTSNQCVGFFTKQPRIYVSVGSICYIDKISAQVTVDVTDACIWLLAFSLFSLNFIYIFWDFSTTSSFFVITFHSKHGCAFVVQVNETFVSFNIQFRSLRLQCLWQTKNLSLEVNVNILSIVTWHTLESIAWSLFINTEVSM